MVDVGHQEVRAAGLFGSQVAAQALRPRQAVAGCQHPQAGQIGAGARDRRLAPVIHQDNLDIFGQAQAGQVERLSPDDLIALIN